MTHIKYELHEWNPLCVIKYNMSPGYRCKDNGGLEVSDSLCLTSSESHIRVTVTTIPT